MSSGGTMLHLFIVDNSRQPEPKCLGEYNTTFPEIIPVQDRYGEVTSTAMHPTKYFNWAYFRIGNNTEAHNDRVYVLARFDFDKYPHIEQYIERRVFPALIEKLEGMQQAFGLSYVENHQTENEVIYIYEGDGAVISHAVSSLFRQQIIKPVV